MKQLVSFTEALEILLSFPMDTGKELVDLEQANGRVLAEDIIAPDNIPPFDRSPLDGYALNSRDTVGASRENPVTLEIVQEVPAGFVATESVTAGTAIKITTGAPMPLGADVVIAYEKTEFDAKSVKIFSPMASGVNISRAGEDVAKGDIVLPGSSRITPPGVGLLAALGFKQVPVYVKPRVAILSTGDELIEIDQQLKPGKIRNSNLYFLAAMLEELGCEPVLYGIVGDDLSSTTAALSQAAGQCDLVISTGGVSVGDYDVVKEAMTGVGGKIIFWRVNIRPGTPMVCGQLGDKLLIGLSGNPAAAFITFELLVKPLILKSFGLPCTHKRSRARLTTPYNKATQQMRFLRGITSLNPSGELVVRLAGMQNPGVMKSLLNYNSLIMVPSGTGPLPIGEMVEVIIIDELEVEQ